MAHPNQLQFMKKVGQHLANDYTDKHILEIGSFDVNGSIRSYFESSSYVGVDLTEGAGVDVVGEGNKLNDPDETYDLTVSCECFEHNPHWSETFLNMYRMTKQGGIVVFTCATTGRLEHGTTRTSPKQSPGTQTLGWDFYLNLTERHFRKLVNLDGLFDAYIFLTNKHSCDLYFIGEKTGNQKIFHFNEIELEAECIEMAAQAEVERQRKIAAESRYPKWLRMLSGASLLPLRLAARLPDPQYQNFALSYNKYSRFLKMPFKFVIDKILSFFNRGLNN